MNGGHSETIVVPITSQARPPVSAGDAMMVLLATAV
jgi:hypothetical protein